MHLLQEGPARASTFHNIVLYSVQELLWFANRLRDTLYSDILFIPNISIWGHHPRRNKKNWLITLPHSHRRFSVELNIIFLSSAHIKQLQSPLHLGHERNALAMTILVVVSVRVWRKFMACITLKSAPVQKHGLSWDCSHKRSKFA
jgi:hypothetical protein